MGRMGKAAAAALVLLAIAAGASSAQAETLDERREELLRKIEENNARIDEKYGRSQGATPAGRSDSGSLPLGAEIRAQCEDITRFIKVAMDRGDTPRTLVGIYTHQLFGCGRKGISDVTGIQSLSVE